MTRLLLSALVLVLFASCGQSESGRESVQGRLSRDDFTIFDLDSVPADTLYPHLVTGMRTAGGNEIQLERPFGHVMVGDTIIVSDQQHRTLLTAHKESTVFNRVVGGQNDGSIELNMPATIVSNDTFIGVQEQSYPRLTLLSHHLEHLASIPLSSGFTSQVDITKDHLFLPASTTSPFLVQVRGATLPNMTDSTSVSAEFFPKLVSFGDPLMSYNRYVVSASEELVVVAYAALPYLFVYHADGSLLQSIRLAGQFVDSFANPWSTGELLRIEPGGPLPSLFYALVVTEDGQIFASTRNAVYRFERDGGGDFGLISTYLLSDTHLTEDDGGFSPVIASGMTVENDELVVCGFFEHMLFRYQF